jgi:DENN (AEX-3) domain
MFQK